MPIAPPADWNGAAVRAWLQSRIVSARADQAAAERAGYGARDECDKAAAEEMICAAPALKEGADAQPAFLAALKALLDRDTFVWRGVYDDDRFDRHARTYIRKLTKMAKTNAGFGNMSRYQ
jgi:hypothetical protein